MSKTAKIYLWNHFVGAVLWDESDGTGVFEYDPDFCKLGLEIAPIMMPAIPGEIYDFPGLNRKTFKGLPGCLADSLPDDFGNALIDAWLAQSGRDKQSFTPVERLLYTGSRGMGALEYAPAINGAQGDKAERLELSSLVDLAAKVLSDREGLTGTLKLSTPDAAEDEALKHLYQIGTSAGGARAKAVIAMNSKGEIRSGQVTAPKGFTYWLLKFDVPANAEALGDPAGFGRVEYAYHLMALQAGIAMTECQLHTEGGRAHFMTRRFDRTDDGEKLHAQTLCAIDHADYTRPGEYSYEQALQVMRDMRISREDQEEFYRRMVFNVIARNQDDHTKNTSFLMDSTGAWMLAPAYDVAWSYRPDSEWVSTHQMTINGKRDHFTMADLHAVAKQIPRFDAEAVIQEVLDAVSRWQDFADQAEVEPEFARQIESTFRMDIL